MMNKRVASFLNVLKKYKYPFAALGLMIIVAFVVFFVVFRKDRNIVSPWKAVHPDAFWVLQIHDTQQLNDDIQNLPFFQFWDNYHPAEKIIEGYIKIIKQAEKDAELNDLFQQSTIFVEAVEIEDSMEFVFVIDLHEVIAFSEAKNCIEKISPEFGFSNIRERKGEQMIYIVNEKEDTVFATFVQNILVLTYSKQLAVDAFAGLTSDIKGEWEDTGIRADHSYNYALYFQNGSLVRFFERYFEHQSFFPWEIIPGSGRIDVKPESNGNLSLFVHDKSDNFVRFLSGEGLFQFETIMFDIPAVLSFADMSDYYKNDSLPEVLQYCDHVFASVVAVPEPGDFEIHQYLCFNVTDSAMLMKDLIKISKPLKEVVAEQYDFGEFYAAVLTKDSVFMQPLFNTSNLSPFRFVILSDSLLFVSSSLAQLERIVYSLQDIMRLDSGMYCTEEELPAFRIDLPQFYPMLLHSTKAQYKTMMIEIFPLLSAFSNLDFLAKSRNDGCVEWNVKFDSSACYRPLIINAENLYKELKYRVFRELDSLTLFPSANYLDSMEGIQNFYFSDSTVLANGAFVDGKAHGTWRFNYPNGNNFAIVEFDQGDIHGKIILFRNKPNGNILASCSYEKNKLSGQFILFHKNGKPSLTALFDKGLTKGKMRFYYKTGTVMAEADISDKAILENWLLYSLTGDFIDVNDLNTTRHILNNFILLNVNR